MIIEARECAPVCISHAAGLESVVVAASKSARDVESARPFASNLRK